MINCPKCGKELPDGTSFCLSCFSSLVEKENISFTSKPENGFIAFLKSKQLRVALSCIAVVAFAIGGAFLLKGKMKPITTVSAESTTLVAVTDQSGETVTGENGEAVMAALVEVTDQSGEAVTNPDGSKVMQAVIPVTNKNGENVTQKDGQLVLEVVDDKESKVAGESTTRKGLFDWLLGGNKDKEESTAAASTAKPETTKPTTQTTAKATTQPTTKPTTQPTTQSTAAATTQPTNSISSKSDFEYETIDNYIMINKYNGKDKNVVVPSEFDGKPVGYLGVNVFPNDTETVTFNSNLVQLNYHAFSHCSKLEAVNFVGASKYKTVDGVVFYTGSSFGDTSLRYYPIGKKTADYILPSFCTRLEKESIRDNPYIKTFTFSAKNGNYELHNQVMNFMGCSNLTAIYTSVDSSNVKSIDGVLYFINVGTVHTSTNPYKFTQFVFPANKQVSHYEFPSEYKIHLKWNSFCGNPYIKSVKFKNRVTFEMVNFYDMQYSSKNLKTFYVLDNEDQHIWYNEQEKYFQSYNANVIFY